MNKFDSEFVAVFRRFRKENNLTLYEKGYVYIRKLCSQLKTDLKKKILLTKIN